MKKSLITGANRSIGLATARQLLRQGYYVYLGSRSLANGQEAVEKPKEKLSTTELSVSEIAYTLGFERSQSFSKVFKSKTALTPLAFRQSFN